MGNNYPDTLLNKNFFNRLHLVCRRALEQYHTLR